ncbi:MAG: hypothetical protein CMJ87_11560, partial [Planctomycetes bacterium]|nr:hypothetical protein [Planctomycetota bacterium]
MSQKAEPPTTQRAYTLRLQGTDRSDQSWRDALWQTHHAANKGSKAFGDWLLTMRGGLDHTLADAKIKGEKKEPDRDPTPPERKDRRILLALSWLSVESKRGAPKEFLVASGHAPAENRNGQVIKALERILEKRGVPKNNIAGWIGDCSASLGAAIRDDAVWINRSEAFDEVAKTLDGKVRKYASTQIMSFFSPKDVYLRLPSFSGDDESEIETASNDGPEFRTLARNWVSTNFGTGQKSDPETIVKQLRILTSANLKHFEGLSRGSFIKELCGRINVQGEDSDALRSGIGWSTGRPSKGRVAIDSLPDPVSVEAILTLQQIFSEEAGAKQSKSNTRDVPEWTPCLRQRIENECGMPFRGTRDHTDEYSVMLDHAARRVSMTHTWIKRAEAKRREFEKDAKRIGQVSEKANKWLDDFCQERSRISGAIEPYRIRRRALGKWEEVVAAWSRSS